MVALEINTQASLFPCYNYRPVSIWQVKRKNGGIGSISFFLSVFFPFQWSSETLSDRSWRSRRGLDLWGCSTILWGWAIGETALPTLHHSPKMTQLQPNSSKTNRIKLYSEDEEAVWYLTKAMAASSLQNSSSTITPSRSVTWSMLQRQTPRWEMTLKHRLRRLHWNTGNTYVMPSGSKPRSLFLTSSSLGVKSGIRWILIMRSPTTCHTRKNKITNMQHIKRINNFLQAHMARYARTIASWVFRSQLYAISGQKLSKKTHQLIVKLCGFQYCWVCVGDVSQPKMNSSKAIECLRAKAIASTSFTHSLPTSGERQVQPSVQVFWPLAHYEPIMNIARAWSLSSTKLPFPILTLDGSRAKKDASPPNKIQ